MAGCGHMRARVMLSCQTGTVGGASLYPKRVQCYGRGYATLFPAGVTILDIYLNHHAFWHNVPLPVWCHTLGRRYQVLKEWPSYGGYGGVLGRGLRAEGVVALCWCGQEDWRVRVGKVEK